MRIASMDGLTARCEAKGAWRDVSLFLLQADLPEVGDYIMVHLGQALYTVSAEDARIAWELYDQILRESGATGGAPV